MKADQFPNCLTAEVRSLSGLGYPPDVYTQNVNECMNAVIKRAQSEKMDVVDCIENLRKEVKVPLQANFFIGDVKSRHDFYYICPKIF